MGNYQVWYNQQLRRQSSVCLKPQDNSHHIWIDIYWPLDTGSRMWQLVIAWISQKPVAWMEPQFSAIPAILALVLIKTGLCSLHDFGFGEKMKFWAFFFELMWIQVSPIGFPWIVLPEWAHCLYELDEVGLHLKSYANHQFWIVSRENHFL